MPQLASPVPSLSLARLQASAECPQTLVLQVDRPSRDVLLGQDSPVSQTLQMTAVTHLDEHFIIIHEAAKVLPCLG